MQTEFTNDDLSLIRDAVPHLDLVAIRSLRRAGFEIVHSAPEPVVAKTPWHMIPRPMRAGSPVVAAK